MSKQLLIEYFSFESTPQMIAESIRKNNGKLIVQGIVQKAGTKNANGRIYPRPILEKEVKRYLTEYVKQNRALGELDHPDSPIVELKNASHNIVDLQWRDDDLFGVIEILTTPSGNILRELLKCGVRVGISSRGVGSVKDIEEGTVEVQDDYEILCWDFVSSPSTPGAFMSPMHLKEGKKIEMRSYNYKKIDEIIRDVICDLTNYCPCKT